MRTHVTPHLVIYRPQFTTILSILERTSGSLLASLVLLLGLFAKYSEVFGTTYWTYMCIYVLLKENTTVVNSLLCVCYTYFIYHICVGMRYIYWERTGSSDKYRYAIQVKSILQTSKYILCLIIFVIICVWIGAVM